MMFTRRSYKNGKLIISRKGGQKSKYKDCCNIRIKQSYSYPSTKLFYHCALRMDITLIPVMYVPGSNENIIHYILYITLYRIL